MTGTVSQFPTVAPPTCLRCPGPATYEVTTPAKSCFTAVACDDHLGDLLSSITKVLTGDRSHVVIEVTRHPAV